MNLFLGVFLHAASTACWWWLRSPAYNNNNKNNYNNYFCDVGTGGSANYNNANYSAGVRP